MPHALSPDSLPTETLLALDNQLCFALYAASRRMQRAYQQRLAELELTYPQYLVLLVLWEWERSTNARRTLTALGERLDLDSGTLTPLVRRLEQKGLVVRKRAPDDGRELLVVLTRAGSALKRRARGVPLSLLARSPMSLEEMIEMRTRLQRLRSALAQRDAVSLA